MHNLIPRLSKKKRLVLYDEFWRRKSKNTETDIYPMPLNIINFLTISKSRF